jgi:hypothetical protein
MSVLVGRTTGIATRHRLTNDGQLRKKEELGDEKKDAGEDDIGQLHFF